MLRNYLKIALRHLWKARLYALLNAAGLAVGVSGVLLALLYRYDERSFDRFHENAPNLYRITTTYAQHRGDQRETNGGTGQVQGPTFAAAVPEILNYVRVMGGDIYEDVRTDTKALKVQPLYVDASFFDVFTFHFLHGNPKTALREVGSVVVTERMARRFFNRTDVVGNLLNLDGDPSAQRLGKPVVISGVVQNPPATSSLQFDLLHPFRFMQLSFEDTNWLNAYLGTFVRLHPSADRTAVTRKFNALYALHAKKQVAESRHSEHHDPQISYGLQALTDIHLHPLYRGRGNREGGIINGSSPVFSYLFLGIAGFILLMATINFINLSIAGSLQRAKEVGVRKVSGGRRGQIVAQHLVESALVCLAAFGLALGLLQAGLPVFNALTEKHLRFAEALDPALLPGFAALFAVVVLLAGFYPAFVLSGFKPTEVLYQRQRLSGRTGFGRGLVVFQFALAVFLLIATVVYYRQMEFIRTKDLGYNPYQVIRSYIAGNGDVKPIQAFLRNELAREPSIRSISFGAEFGEDATVVNGKTLRSRYQAIDEAYLPTLDISLRAGRNFSAAFPADEGASVLVNEAFVKAANLKGPLGTRIQPDTNFIKTPLTIVGVVRDFHFGSLRERIQPLVFFRNTAASGGIWVKLEKTRQAEGRAVFEKAYRKALPQAVYDAQFLDEMNAADYRQEQRWQQLIGYAAGLAGLICCVGLFGLTRMAAQQRTKEIGVRKVLGASVVGIAVLLSREFLKLVLLAVLMASPLAGYAMQRWLENFAYRVGLPWWLFAGVGLLALGVALLTVSFQSVKAARMNPVKSLRSE